MQTIGLRKYSVKSADFPIAVLIAAKNLPACRAVAGPVQILTEGGPGGSIAIKQVDNAAAKTTSYSIRKPAQVKSDLVQTIHAFFSSPAATNSKYDITITSATGDVATTTMSRPTIDPGMAVLVFRLR
jgi:hypothetical protein